MQHHNPQQGFGPAINRITDLMDHTSRYAFDGLPKLAQDAGISQKSLWRMIRDEVRPSFFTVARLADAFERELKRRIDPRDIVAEFGRFPTRYTCDLSGCRGCRPDAATDEFGDLKHIYLTVEPGQWVTSRYPLGFEATKGGNNAN